MNGQPRVIKLGGSLLDWPDLATSFERWLAREPPAPNVVIVGGGPMVEALRQLDRVQPMPPETAHWLAIRAMGMTAALAAKLLHDAVVVPALEQLPTNGTTAAQILDVERLMREDADRDDALPRSWEVTSDSIAARVAQRIDARELVLLKSSLPERPATRDALSCGGYVDAYFPVAAKSLAVRCVNLRDGKFPQLEL